MKRFFYCVLLFLLFILPGCAGKQNGDNTQTNSTFTDVNGVIPEGKQSTPGPDIEGTNKKDDVTFQKKWEGDWNRTNSGMFNQAILSISNETPESFDFTIDSSSGGNVGQVSGKAGIKGDRASYKDEKYGAQLTFLMRDGLLIVEENDEAMHYGGMGVFFKGEYVRGEIRKTEETLHSMGIFEDKEQDTLFRKLVGDSYGSFVGSSQLVYEEEDLDGFGAKVYHGGVRGLYTIMENIIMITPDGRIWAAVIEGDQVSYFTNDLLYFNKLPKTVEKWREHFKDKKVVFMSSK